MNYDMIFTIIKHIPSQQNFHLLFVNKKINNFMKSENFTKDSTIDKYYFIKICIGNKFKNLIHWWISMNYELPRYYHMCHIYFNKHHIGCDGCYTGSKFLCDDIFIRQSLFNTDDNHFEDIINESSIFGTLNFGILYSSKLRNNIDALIYGNHLDILLYLIKTHDAIARIIIMHMFAIEHIELLKMVNMSQINKNINVSELTDYVINFKCENFAKTFYEIC